MPEHRESVGLILVLLLIVLVMGGIVVMAEREAAISNAYAQGWEDGSQHQRDMFLQAGWPKPKDEDANK